MKRKVKIETENYFSRDRDKKRRGERNTWFRCKTDGQQTTDTISLIKTR